ncbi:MAG: hypothetical protein ACI841_000275 [Planctomycetota bacterium]|jgi:hypothetical protein
MNAVIITLAVLSVVMIPLAPKLILIRIRMLKWLNWSWAVNLLEKYFDEWVLFARIILLVIAVWLFYVGWEGLRD